jgi:hypothetical protein
MVKAWGLSCSKCISNIAKSPLKIQAPFLGPFLPLRGPSKNGSFSVRFLAVLAKVVILKCQGKTYIGGKIISLDRAILPPFLDSN